MTVDRIDEDTRLRQHVLDELDFEPSVESNEIGVLVEDAVVTLVGHVRTYPQKLAAKRAVWRVRGVKAVVDHVEVRQPDEPTADEDLVRRALDVLKWDAAIPDAHLRVSVNKGWVTLEGEVDWNYQRQGAESRLRNLAGVLGITNHVTVRPVVQAAPVKQRIEEALRRNAALEAARIRVEVMQGGTVALEGEVDSWTARAEAERAAWSAAGVHGVVDRLRIR